MYRGVCVPTALVVLLVLTLVVPGAQSCPRSCNCYQASEVHCTFRSLLTIPPGLPAHTRRINLGFNSINKIHDSSLAGLKKVELLMLHSNDLYHLPDGVFKDMKSLQILKLSYNKLREISSSLTFSGLTSLLRLYLDHNHIQHIHPRALLQLPSLRLLRLQGNRLHQLHPHTLCTLSLLNTYYFSTLRHLDLSNNSLTTLPKDTLATAPLLETLVLQANPWSCDCKMNWFLIWSLAHPGLMKCPGGPQCPTCASPVALQGHGLLDRTDLSCTSPVISSSGTNSPLETELSEIYSRETFREPLGSASVGLSDQQGNSVDLSCNITLSSNSQDIAPPDLSSSSPLSLALSVSLECPLERHNYEKLWRILAYYSETAVHLEREIMLSKAPALAYRYRQTAETDGYYHTGVKASVKVRPQWLLQPAISIQLNRAQSNGNKVHLIYSTRVSAHPGPPSFPSTASSSPHSWILISTNNATTALAAVSGSKLELSCPFKSSGNPKVQWILPDGSKLISSSSSLDGRLQASASGLLLHKVQLSDAGLYYCVAQAGRDVDVLPLRLAVEESSVPPSGEEVGPPASATVGESVSLPCQASGSPAPHMFWLLPDGNIIHFRSAVSGALTIQPNGSLSLPNLSLRDAGHYRCIAVNPYGSDSLSMQLKLKPQLAPPLRISFPRGPQSAAGRSTKIRAPLLRQLEEGSGDEEEEEQEEEEGEKSPVGNRNHPRLRQPLPNRRYPIGKPRRRGPVREGSPRRGGGPVSSTDQRRNHFSNRHRVSTNKQIDPKKWADLLAKIRQKTAHTDNSQTITEGKPTAEPVGGGKSRDTKRNEGADDKETDKAESAEVEAESEGSSVDDTVLQEEGLQPFRPVIKETQTDTKTQTETVRESLTKTHTDTETKEIETGRERLAETQTDTVPTTHMQTQNPGPQMEAVTNSETQKKPVTPGTNDILPELSEADNQGENPNPPRTRPQKPSQQGHSPNLVPNSRSQSRWNSRRRIGQQRRIFNRPRVQPLTPPQPFPDPTNQRSQIVTPGTNTNDINMSTTTSPVILLTRNDHIRTVPNEVPLNPPSSPVPSTPSISSSESAYTTMTSSSTSFTSLSSSHTRTHIDGMTHSDTATPALTHYNAVIRQTHMPDTHTRTLTHGIQTHRKTHTALGKHVARPPSKHSEEKDRNSLGVPHESHATTYSSVVSTTVTSAAPTTKAKITSLSTTLKSTHFIGSAVSTTGESFVTPSEDILPTKTTPMTANPITSTITTIIIPTSSTTRSTTTSSTTRSTTTSSTTRSTTTTPTSTITTTTPIVTSTAPTTTITSSTSPSTTITTTTTTTPIVTSTAPTTTTTSSATPSTTTTTTTTTSTKRSFKSIPTTPDSTTTTFATTTTATTPIVTSNAPTTTTTSSATPSTTTTTTTTTTTSTKSSFKTIPITPDFAITTTTPAAPAAPATSIRVTTSAKTVPAITPTTVTTTMTSTSTGASFKERPSIGQVYPRGKPVSGAPNRSQSPPDWKNPRANSIPDSHSSRPHRPSSSSFPAVPGAPVLRSRPRIADPHIRTVSFPANGTARLDCEAQGEPKPSITWTKVATGAVMSVHSKAKRFEVLPNGTLVIQNVQLQDRGTYICSAQSFLGRDRLLTTLEVWTRPPRMQLASYREATIHQGGELLLECQADGVPTPLLSWVLPDRSALTSAAQSTSRIFVDTNGTLHISVTLPSDRGMYRCVASNLAGAASSTVRVHVSSLPPVIQQPREEHLLLSPGRPVYAHCSARGAPPPTLRWRIPDGTLVRPSQFLHGNLFVLPNGTLHIRRLGPKDSGNYECTASNAVGAVKRTLRVEIEGGAEGGRRDGGTRKEETKAVATEKSSPSYSLNKDRPSISNHPAVSFNSSKFPPPSLPDRSRTLPLTPSPSHSSSHPHQPSSTNSPPKINKTVTVSPPHFTNNNKTKLSSLSPASTVPTNNTKVLHSIVNNKRVPFIPPSDNSRASVVLHPVPVFSKARIVSTSPSISTIHYGGFLQLHCSVTGNPPPIIIWRTPSRKLVDMNFSFDRRLKVHPNGTLSVQAVMEKDAGDYLCIARNKVADDYRLLRVSVATKPAKIEPKQPVNQMVSFGKPLKVDCQASGLPDPAVHWSLPDGTMVNSVLQGEDRGGRARRLTVFDNGTLLVPAVGMKEEGEYTCYAENQGGQDTMKVKVKVMMTSPPTFTDDRGYHVVKVRQGTTAIIRCHATGDPSPTVTWFSPAHRVIPRSLGSGYYSERVVVVSGGTLEVRLAQKFDTGNYTCQASNTAGERSMVVGLEVEAFNYEISGQVGGRRTNNGPGDSRSRENINNAGIIQYGLTTGASDKLGINNSRSSHRDNNGKMTGVNTGSNPAPRIDSQNGFNKPVTGITTQLASSIIRVGGAGSNIGNKADNIGINRNGLGSVSSSRNSVGNNHSTVRGESAENSPGTNNNEVIAGRASNDAITSGENGRISGIPRNVDVNSGASNSGSGTSTARGNWFSRTSNIGVSYDDSKNSGGTAASNTGTKNSNPTVVGVVTTVKQRVLKGKTALFPCPSQGSPPPRVSWLLPGNGVLPAPYYGSRLTVHRNGSLELRGVRTSDAGMLVCVVRGERGEARIQVELEVSEAQEEARLLNRGTAVERPVQKSAGLNEAPHSGTSSDSSQSLSSLLPERSHPRIPVTQKPPVPPRPINPPLSSTSPVSQPAVSTRAGSLVSIINGETLRLPCPVPQTPAFTHSSLSWTMPSGKVLSQGESGDSGRYSVQADGTLTVQQASVFDRGTYTCRATSSDSSSVSHLTVPVIVIAYPPHITAGPAPVTYTRPGVAVELPCLTIATPRATVTWETPDLTQLRVMGQARIYGNIYLSPQGSLVIQNPTSRDTGFYRCTAKNVMGVDTKATYLHVI